MTAESAQDMTFTPRPTTVATRADRTEPVRRFAAAAGLVLGAAGLLTANTMYAWVTTVHGGRDSIAVETLALFGAHPTFVHAAVTAAMVGSLVLVPGLVAAMRLLRDRSPWLSLVGGTMMSAGYICYLAINADNFEKLALAQRGVTGPEVTAALDAGMADPVGLWPFMTFALGNLVGTPIFAGAVIRARIVPLWAGLGIMSWAPLHVIGLIADTEWFEVAGAAFQLIGLAAMALVILRSPAR